MGLWEILLHIGMYATSSVLSLWSCCVCLSIVSLLVALLTRCMRWLVLLWHLCMYISHMAGSLDDSNLGILLKLTLLVLLGCGIQLSSLTLHIISTLHTMPKALSQAILQSVLSKLDSGLSIPKISAATGVSAGAISNICSEHHPNLPKSSGGCPSKLTPTDVHHAVCFVTSSNSTTTTQAI